MGVFSFVMGMCFFVWQLYHILLGAWPLLHADQQE